MSCSNVLNRQCVKSLATSWLANEPAINYVGFSVDNEYKSAVVHMHSLGTLAGTPFVDAILTECGCTINWLVREGDALDVKDVKVATISGFVSDIMISERLIVSVLSRASGIASFAKKLKKMLTDVSWKGNLRVNSNFAPFSGLIDEYALMLSGVVSDKSSVLVRQCHVAAAGSVEKAIQLIRSKVPSNVTFEVECSNLSDARAAAAAAANVVIFNRMSIKDMTVSATQLKNSHPNVQVQVSGTFDESNIKSLANPNIDLITTNKLCCGYTFIDFEIKFENELNGMVSTDKVPLEPCSQPGKSEKSEPTDTTASDDQTHSNPPAAKKSRLEDSVTPVTASSPTVTAAAAATTISNAKPSNSIPVRKSTTASTTGLNTSSSGAINTNPNKEQQMMMGQQKRPLRNQRNSNPSSNKPQQMLQMTSPSVGNQRFMPYAGGGMSRTGSNPNLYQNPNSAYNAVPLLGTNQMAFGRAESSQQQRMTVPSLRPSVGFLDMQQLQRQQISHWAAGGNPMMMGGGRMDSKIVKCGACGEVNPFEMLFCRRCRVPLR